MTKGTGFWNFMAKRYAKSNVADPAAYERKLSMTRELLAPDMEIVEFGCGTGTTAIAHAPHVKHILASDFSPRMLAIARDKAAAAGIENITFREAELADLGLADDSVDMVQGHSILHLLPEWRDALAEAFRIIRPGGAFVTSTACIGEGAAIFRWIVPIAHAIGVLPPVQFFSRDMLETEMVATGFVIEESWQPKPGAAVFLIARKPV